MQLAAVSERFRTQPPHYPRPMLSRAAFYYPRTASLALSPPRFAAFRLCNPYIDNSPPLAQGCSPSTDYRQALALVVQLVVVSVLHYTTPRTTRSRRVLALCYLYTRKCFASYYQARQCTARFRCNYYTAPS